jgi:hypothetical protein
MPHKPYIMFPIIYLTCIRNFLTVLHKDLFSNNFRYEESFWVLTNNILRIQMRQDKVSDHIQEVINFKL